MLFADKDYDANALRNVVTAPYGRVAGRAAHYCRVGGFGFPDRGESASPSRQLRLSILTHDRQEGFQLVFIHCREVGLIASMVSPSAASKPAAVCMDLPWHQTKTVANLWTASIGPSS